jgi:hypothetical protein
VTERNTARAELADLREAATALVEHWRDHPAHSIDYSNSDVARRERLENNLAAVVRGEERG